MDEPMDEQDMSNGMHRYPDPDYVSRITRYPWMGEPEDRLSFDLQDRVREPSSDLETKEHFRSPTAFEEINESFSNITDAREDDSTFDPDYQGSDSAPSGDDVVSDASITSSSLNTPGPRRSALWTNRGQTPRKRGCSSRGGRPTVARGGKGIKRGLRKPIEPTPEFKALHSAATMAYIAHEYEKAEQLTLEALMLNPEMYQAHSLLSEIHAARGDKDKALSAAWNGAHTRPRDTQLWSKMARSILERGGANREANARDAVYCYNRVISVDKSNIEARYQRAALNYELGHKRKVAFDYEQLIKRLPHDTVLLRHLAEIYIELNEPERALCHYEAAIIHFQSIEPENVSSFTWSDVNIVAELYGFQQRYEEAISQLKSLARWLLGRSGENCWEMFEEDDREWDLDDQPRRIVLEHFVPGQYPSSSYGNGLPLELRIKLGIFRLFSDKHEFTEAVQHFEWLSPEDDSMGAKLHDYPDLFREAGNALCEREHFQDALKYYEPLQQIEDSANGPFLMDLAWCYRAAGQSTEAEACYNVIIDNEHEEASEARSALMEMRWESGTLSSEAKKAETIMSIFKKRSRKRGGGKGMRRKDSTGAPQYSSFPMLAPRLRPQHIEKPNLEGDLAQEQAIYQLFVHRRELAESLRNQDKGTNTAWIQVTKGLLETFRNSKVFYPFEKFHRFFGYSREARMLASRPKYEQEMLMAKFDSVLTLPDGQEIVIPNDYCGISFENWLDIFLEYALTMAKLSDTQAAYEIIASAFNANIFFHSQKALFSIHVCWFTCALIGNDDETLCSVARWFMKEYQFVTDGYRLFSALNKFCDSENTWFNCGPSQKYILRQVKAVDFSFVGDASRKGLFQDRASYTTKDTNGEPLQAEEMDVALLMLYGHILYAGASYAYAVNYYLRALALDVGNPSIKLSLALGYIHWALRRQAENRHAILMQGFSFMFEYYHIRQEAGNRSQRQEAEYNLGRAYHLLGLTHLAIPYYERCLVQSLEVEKENGVGRTEDFAHEAAFALQGIWATNGNVKAAREVTELWLTI